MQQLEIVPYGAHLHMVAIYAHPHKHSRNLQGPCKTAQGLKVCVHDHDVVMKIFLTLIKCRVVGICEQDCDYMYICFIIMLKITELVPQVIT